MDIPTLTAQALNAYNAGGNISLVLPRPWRRRPKGFPRGELLCEQPGSGVYSYDPMKVLAWLHKNELITLSVAAPPCSDGEESSREA